MAALLNGTLILHSNFSFYLSKDVLRFGFKFYIFITKRLCASILYNY